MTSLTPRHRWMVAQVVAVFNLGDHEPVVESLFRDQFASKVDPFLKGASLAQHLIFSYQGNGDPFMPTAGVDGRLVCTGEVAKAKTKIFALLLATIVAWQSLQRSVRC